MMQLLQLRFTPLRRAACVLSVLLCLSAPGALSAQDPTLDLSFSDDGKWFYSDEPSYDVITDMVVDASGRIVLVGYTNYDPDESGKNRGVVIRLLPNGIPDDTLYIDFPNSTDEVQGAAFDDAGNIILCGQTNIADGAVYKMLSSSFTLDPNFGIGGRVVLPVAAELNDVAVLSSGKIVAAGYGSFGGDNDFLVTRFNANGTLDTGFGTNSGYTPYGTSENEYANAMVVQSSGKIVVSGYRRTCTNDNCLDPVIGRFLENGQFDTNFGLKVIASALNEAVSYSVALQNIGGEERIILSGYYEPSGDNYQGFVLRLRDNGNDDGSFGFKPLPEMQGCVATVQGNGKILLASYNFYTQNSQLYGRLRLMRLNADGSKDATFGNGGTHDEQLSGFVDGPNVLQTVGNKIYVAGGVFQTSNNFSDADGFVARFTTGPTTSAQDLALSLGIRVYPNPTAQALTVQCASAALRQVSIINSTGQVLAERFDVRENTPNVFDLSALPAGQYFVRVVPEGQAGAVALPVIKL